MCMCRSRPRRSRVKSRVRPARAISDAAAERQHLPAARSRQVRIGPGDRQLEREPEPLLASRQPEASVNGHGDQLINPCLTRSRPRRPPRRESGDVGWRVDRLSCAHGSDRRHEDGGRVPRRRHGSTMRMSPRARVRHPRAARAHPHHAAVWARPADREGLQWSSAARVNHRHAARAVAAREAAVRGSAQTRASGSGSTDARKLLPPFRSCQCAAPIPLVGCAGSIRVPSPWGRPGRCGAPFLQHH
jgi:hypothetical protein